MRKLVVAIVVVAAILVSTGIFLCACSSSSAEQGDEQEVVQDDTECIWDGAEFWLTYASYHNVLQLHATATKGPGYLLTGTDNTEAAHYMDMPGACLHIPIYIWATHI
jgi:hypothetical protein